MIARYLLFPSIREETSHSIPNNTGIGAENREKAYGFAGLSSPARAGDSHSQEGKVDLANATGFSGPASLQKLS